MAISRSETRPETSVFCPRCTRWFLEDIDVAGKKLLSGQRTICIKCDPASEERPYVVTGKGLLV